MKRPRLLSLAVVGWVLFDFASTIFAFVILTRYFNDWIVVERGQPDFLIGLMLAAVSVALVLLLPTFGGLADRLGRHHPLLVVFVLVSVAATVALGMVEGVALALVVAWLAIVAFQCGQAQYHPLLASVAAPERQGLVSGLGIAIGFGGTLTALLALSAIVVDGDSQTAFLPAAALYFAFALPCLAFVRDRASPVARDAASPRAPLRTAAGSIRRAAGEHYGRLLLARFLYIDAVATAIMFLTVYAERAGLADDDVDRLFLFSTPFAIVGALGAGVLSRRIGPRRVLLGTLAAVAIALLVTGLSGSSAFLWVAGPIVALTLGSLTATDRVFLMRLVPPEHRGDGFGLYALVGNLSSGFGPLVLWGGTILLLHEALAVAGEFDASRAAVCLLALSALAGAALVRTLPERGVEQAAV